MATEPPVSVLVPYRPDGGHRDRSWAWLAQRWTAMRNVEVLIEPGEPGAHPGEFNHPLAINRAAARAAGDVFIVADCDTAFDPDWVNAAVDLVASGHEPWVMPLHYDKLTEASTAAVLANESTAPISLYEHEWRGTGICWSGLVVVPRAAFVLVGGYDERFAFWGADDVCFGLTMDALWGAHHRLDGAAMHLWHPQPLEHTYGHPAHDRQQRLVERYKAAAGDGIAIRKARFG